MMSPIRVRPPSGAMEPLMLDRLVLAVCLASVPLAAQATCVGGWCVLAFADAQGHVEAVAAGRRPDWARRAPLRELSFEAGAARATSVARAGDLELRTEMFFDAQGPYLLVALTLSNVGTQT